MTVELRPLGVQCNIQCQYCYQTPQRDAGSQRSQYNMQKMKEAILVEGGPFTLFGGEPLLVPERDLEELWSWGLAQFGRNSIQTNGTLINANHNRIVSVQCDDKTRWNAFQTQSENGSLCQFR